MLSSVVRALKVFPRKLRALLFLSLVLRLVGNGFAVLGTALMAFLVAFLAAILSGVDLPAQFALILEVLRLENYSLRNQVILVGALVIVAFLAKPVILLPLTYYTGLRMQMFSVQVATEMYQKFFNLPLSSIRLWGTPQITYALGGGLGAVMGVVTSGLTIIGEVTLILMFGGMLTFADPVMTIALVGYMAGLFWLLTWISGDKLKKAGRVLGKNSALMQKNIFESTSGFREMTVSGIMHKRVHEFNQNRTTVARTGAVVAFLNQIPRYVIDLALILGIVLVAVFQISQENVVAAAAITVLFLAAATRMLPTIGPIQGAINGIKRSVGESERFYDFKDWLDLQTMQVIDEDRADQNLTKPSLKYDISVNNLKIIYPKSDIAALQSISFFSKHGESIAIIGKSGSGKTTLADALLGLLIPQEGSVKLGNNTPLEVRSFYPGTLAYVSQDVALIDGSIKENIAFGVEIEDIDDEQVINALKRAEIWEFVEKLPYKINTVVGERGTRLSGGQRQRIGIARALYSNPVLLVLDEATSALDAETEAAITDMLRKLHGEITVVAIAHRLSTVRHSDLVLFLRDGVLVDQGKFDDLVNKHPDLARQASLLGMDVVE